MHTIRARVLGPEDGEVAGAPGFRRDRFMVDGADAGRRLSVVEHTLGPRVLAGPLQFHTREDEFSFVLEGRLGARWATRRSSPARGPGLQAARAVAHLDDFDPATLPAMAEAYGRQVDFEGTAAVIERHGLRF